MKHYIERKNADRKEAIENRIQWAIFAFFAVDRTQAGCLLKIFKKNEKKWRKFSEKM